MTRIEASEAYDAREQELIAKAFAQMLASATRDGGNKRRRGEKPPWWRDPSHMAALYRHLEAWETGERFDPDSGVHPLVALAWRGLAVAYQETYGQVAPK